ncbi:hypothetical protein Rmet_3772 (plasmid) [Cupriavidus metallidurans CH34]|uniref:Uncharacterized protein n=1 Tax=Cupriavidus metallidurans (strain ATCC 43123 / DSM 2839 / NBRC 102507 / CH34) TaxID=266264 RepID=Q1LGT4_CUPMC|nr:hypothetical protein Rmet_3772 [Cupriavidus metallidurans CH34]
MQLREMAELRIKNEAITDAVTSLLMLGKKQDTVVKKLRELAMKKSDADASWLVKQYLAWESEAPAASDAQSLEMRAAQEMEQDQRTLMGSTAV